MMDLLVYLLQIVALVFVILALGPLAALAGIVVFVALANTVNWILTGRWGLYE